MSRDVAVGELAFAEGANDAVIVLQRLDLQALPVRHGWFALHVVQRVHQCLDRIEGLLVELEHQRRMAAPDAAPEAEPEPELPARGSLRAMP